MARLFTSLLAAAAAAVCFGAVASADKRELHDYPGSSDRSSVVTAASLTQLDASTWSAIYYAISSQGFPSISVDSATISTSAYQNLTSPPRLVDDHFGNFGSKLAGSGSYSDANDDLRVGRQIFGKLNSTSIAWQISLFSVVEYVANTTFATDANNVVSVVNTGFHPATDQKVQEISLSNAAGSVPFGFDGRDFEDHDLDGRNGSFTPKITYQAIGVAQTVVSGANVTVYTVQGTFAAGGNIKLIARIGSSPFTVNGNTIAAGNVKFDVEIENFPYKRNDSSLAIRMLIASRVSELNINTANKTHSFDGTINKGGFFGWNNTVAADGAAVAVAITNASDWRAQEGGSFFYSFTGTNVKSYVWDPEVAVAAAGASSDASIPAASALFVVGAATLASLLM